jgi:penicillin-binding protein 1A
MASSQSYDTSQFNLAATGERQPGSSFKPFVLTTAVNQGMDPETTTFPAPSTITLTPPGSEPWTVSGGAGGSITLADATANSVNTVFAQLGVDVGPANFDEMAHKMGITSELQGVYAEALGGTSTCCTVLEMSNAYATLANGGVHHDPTAITKVVFPNGKVDKPEDSEGTRVISDGVAYTVANVMEGTLDFGTAQGYDLPGCTAAGKTGTTEEQSDAWFVGYTPDVSTAVWTGNPDARTPLPGYGATLSAPVWQDYMEVAATKGCRDFPAPKDPADLSTYSSSSASSSSTYDTTSTTTTTTPTTTTPAATGGDTNGDGYPDNAYAPGIQGNGGN